MDRARFKRVVLRCAACAGGATALLAAGVGPASAATPLPGVPTDDSLLFTLDARSGELTKAGKSKSHYQLTLSGVDRRATWFTDRPQRDAGHVTSKRLFKSWGKLGFRESPPNGALVIDAAPRKRDVLALELRLRSYKAAKRQAKFDARRLGSLGNGLKHLNSRLDKRRPLRFRSSALFIDNTSATVGCSLGQPQLLPRADADVLRMLPADGGLLPIAGNEALFTIYGTTFGGDGRTNFAVPKLAAPANMGWYICTAGYYPSPNSLGETCSLGEVDYWKLSFPLSQLSDPNWLPADGRTIPASQYTAYASAYGTGQAGVQLPNLPAPPGFTSLVCVGLAPVETSSLSQVDMYVGQPGKIWGQPVSSMWMPANGALLQVPQNQALYAILDNNFGGQSNVNFNLPTLASPGAGLSYYIAVEGLWPYD